MSRCLLIVLALMQLVGGPAGAQEFLPPEQAFQVEVAEVDSEAVHLRWTIHEGYYLYRKSIAVEAASDPAQAGPPELPPGEVREDPYFGRTEIYFDELTARVPLTATALPETLALQVHHQGCADGGICYPPQTTTLRVATDGVSGSVATGGNAGSGGSTGSGAAAPEQDRLAALLGSATLGWTLLAFFGAGLLLTFTPCVLPMLPILSSIIVGAGGQGGMGRGLVLSLAYVLPMAVTYAALGAAAGLAGANLQAYLQAPWVIVPFAMLFVLLALALFGVFELRLPAGWQSRLSDLSGRLRGGTLLGVAGMGLLSALIVGPCMTAPLAGALLYIGQTGDAVIGGLALFALGLGMGTPLLIVGTVGARVLPRAGTWMQRVQGVFGFMLLAVAVYLLSRILPGPVTMALWGLWLLTLAVTLGTIKARTGAAERLKPIGRVAGLAAGVWGVAVLVGAAGGAVDPLRPLGFLAEQPASAADASYEAVADLPDLRARIAEASAQGRPVVVDFYADWCVSCKIMEREVFGNPDVQTAMANVLRLKPDVTENNAADRELMSALAVAGPPTLLFYGPDGDERRGQRIVGEVGPHAFLQRLNAALGG